MRKAAALFDGTPARLISSWIKNLKTVWAGLVMLAIFSASPAFAATIHVTSLADGGAGSLRAAITSASYGDTIVFDGAGTITLISGKLLIDKNLTISGPGASSLAIRGHNTGPAGTNFRVFEIQSARVTISGLTIENGEDDNPAAASPLLESVTME